jgi:coenzyme F420-0:L-glutamate ligase/coenzyme F420-1:gamma-L-glutamate ligase
MIQPGADLAETLAEGLRRNEISPAAGDVIVVASKIVSKAEARQIDLATVVPSERAEAIATQTHKEPRLVELILSEATEVVRARPGVLLTRHRLGFVSANAGVDQSNVGLGPDVALLLPVDPDESAAHLRARLAALLGIDIAVVIADTHGRPFRRGNIGVAIGVAGIAAVVDQRGQPDLFGRTLQATVVPVADAIAAAATLVMGEGNEGRPVALVRGLGLTAADGHATELLRSREEDLFAANNDDRAGRVS